MAFPAQPSRTLADLLLAYERDYLPAKSPTTHVQGVRLNHAIFLGRRGSLV